MLKTSVRSSGKLLKEFPRLLRDRLVENSLSSTPKNCLLVALLSRLPRGLKGGGCKGGEKGDRTEFQWHVARASSLVKTARACSAEAGRMRSPEVEALSTPCSTYFCVCVNVHVPLYLCVCFRIRPATYWLAKTRHNQLGIQSDKVESVFADKGKGNRPVSPIIRNKELRTAVFFPRTLPECSVCESTNFLTH